MNSTALLLLYAASVVGAFIGWYACGPIQATSVRCVARASLIALIVQPPFALISIGITWLIALGLIFGIPALRTHQNRWPPSVQELFIDGYIFKFLLFGLLHAMLMVTVLYADETRYGAMQGIGYALFFAGAAINFVLCFRAVTSKNANPYLVPVLFAAPVFFGTSRSGAVSPATQRWPRSLSYWRLPLGGHSIATENNQLIIRHPLLRS